MVPEAPSDRPKGLRIGRDARVEDDKHEDRHARGVGQDLIPAALVGGVHHDAGDGGDDQQDDDEA